MVDASFSAVSLRLDLLGLPLPKRAHQEDEVQLVKPILARERELRRRLADKLCASDRRAQKFLDDYFKDTQSKPKIPRRTLVLDEPGLARQLSLPHDGDSFTTEMVSSYRVAQGVLHNPKNDRRTTKGVFHIATGGLAIPDDKIAVDIEVAARLFELAFQPPEESLKLPFTINEDKQASCWVSLLLRPLVVPEVPGFSHERSMEIRFIVPGSLVANLDFVEGVFGNGGDPYLSKNDASLHPETWTGQTGMVILAPHLTKIRKKDLGMPHWEQATERQRRDGQCYKNEDELYNDGLAFKLCVRDERGVIVTVIADNYYGYCKKEVKTQISYSANLFGLVEEEHAGGVMCFPSYTLGQQFTDKYSDYTYTLEEVLKRNPGRFVPQAEGHAFDKVLSRVVLVPEQSTFSLRDQRISWTRNGKTETIHLRADKDYVTPDGYVVQLHKSEADGTQWSLVGISPKAVVCHKPATVSGGGKSEISKALSDAFVFGNAYTKNFDEDMKVVTEILAHDFTNRFRDPAKIGTDTRSILSDLRSVGSVIKLLTVNSDEYNDEYNEWLESIPQYIKELVFVVKRFYRPEWGENWLDHFSVGIINGRKGIHLRLDGEKIMVNMLRVGFEKDGSWRLFSLRHDFNPVLKVQTEDDITASIVAPGDITPDATDAERTYSRKYVANCEELLFQRPDEAIHRGYDKVAERDLATPGTFASNFEPLSREDAETMVEDAVALSAFTAPMQDLIKNFANGQPADVDFFVSSANPRINADGKRSKNPRYLQKRPDLVKADETALADLSTHLFLKAPIDKPLKLPVHAVIAGRRNNPAEENIPPLCAYNPLHYMPLPELLMEFTCSMTGKSPSTTGAGTEGAMTKNAFNALPTIIDLNAALLSFALTGYDGWLSSAGYIGPNVQVDHDISLLVPEIFSRMSQDERVVQSLIAEKAIKQLEDFEYKGEMIHASRLGYRMTKKFALKYFGRIFMHPDMVFTEEMLKPELQDIDAFVDSLKTIVATHQKVAKAFISDGTIKLACPPVKALLEIMANGISEEGWDLHSPEFRALFDREEILASDWYKARLESKQEESISRIKHNLVAMEDFMQNPANQEAAQKLDIVGQIEFCQNLLSKVSAAEYLNSLEGTLGRQVNWR